MTIKKNLQLNHLYGDFYATTMVEVYKSANNGREMELVHSFEINSLITLNGFGRRYELVMTSLEDRRKMVDARIIKIFSIVQREDGKFMENIKKTPIIDLYLYRNDKETDGMSLVYHSKG